MEILFRQEPFLAPQNTVLWNLIDTYEHQNRGFYGGAIGFISFQGRCQSWRL